MNKLAASAIAILTAFATPAWADDFLFRDDQYLFRFLYPDTWAQVTPRGKNIRAFVVNEAGKGLANCSVLVRPIPELEHLSRAEIEAEVTGLFTREFMEETVGQSAPGAEIVQTSEDKLDNRPAGFALMNVSYQTAGVRVDMTSILVVTFTRLGMYEIFCGAARNQFERTRPEMMKIITSFAFEDYGN